MDTMGTSVGARLIASSKHIYTIARKKRQGRVSQAPKSICNIVYILYQIVGVLVGEEADRSSYR